MTYLIKVKAEKISTAASTSTSTTTATATANATFTVSTLITNGPTACPPLPPCQIPLKIPRLCSQNSLLTCPCLPQIHILNQVHLPVLIPQVLQNHSHLTSRCRILPRLHHMNQVTLLVEVHQPSHLRLRKKILLVEILQYFQQLTHLNFQHSILSQLRYINQVNLPMNVPQAYQLQPHLI